MIRCLPLLLLATLHTTPAVASPQLDRLFMTPAERFSLERIRQQGGNLEEGWVKPENSEQITLDGYVRNSQGKATAWFNHGTGDARLPPQMRGEDSRMRQPGRVIVERAGRRIELKVGQTYDAASGTVREQYQGALPKPAASSAR